jgi:hypothetical protein
MLARRPHRRRTQDAGRRSLAGILPAMSRSLLRSSLPLIVVLGAFSLLLSAQAPPPAASDAAEPLPVRRVVLYKTGVGYFEHRGTVSGAQAITIRFTSAQLNDVLKSLTAIDLGKGQVTGISYNSVAPVEERLEALRLPLGPRSTMADLLGSLRGARIEITSAGATVAGRLLSVEQQSQRQGDDPIDVAVVSLVTDAGELRNFELTPAVRIRLSERSMRDELTRYLDVIGSSREQDVRNMVITTSGSGDRPLFVSYISEVPIWKSSYRLVFPEDGHPLLQGWAIVDNTIGEDWRGVQLSLVAGAPQSYIQQLSQPLYGRRPEVPMPSNLLLQPQTHSGTLRVGRGMVSGTVRDTSGAVIPGVTVELRAASGELIRGVTDADGGFELLAPAGQYQMRVTIQGFTPVTRPILVPAGGTVTQDVALRVGALTETVGIGADALMPSARPAPPPPPAAPMPYAELKESAAAATGADLGELFEYRIKEPVTLQKNQSALVPIVSSQIQAERVSLWKGKSGSGRPRRAMWLTNTTGLTLDGGSMTIIDGDVFAGEGLLEALKPSERRLVSYAADLGVLVEASTNPVPARLSSLTIRDGIITQQSEQSSTTRYAVRNEGPTPARLIVEHALQPGWTLAAGQAPVESTAGAERFGVTVPAAGENTLGVTEVSARTSRVRVADVGDPLIAELTASGVDPGRLEQALRPVIVAKAALAAIDRRIADIDAERKRIVEDQQRLRENMKALRGSSEERQLLQRYTRQLDEQESRLGELQSERARLGAERASAATNLAKAIESVSFDWKRGA